MPKPIHRTTFTVEVFSEGPLNLTERSDDSWSDLAALDYLISDGDCIGLVTQTAEMIVPAEALDGELRRIGNDGTFFDSIDGDDEDDATEAVTP